MRIPTLLTFNAAAADSVWSATPPRLNDRHAALLLIAQHLLLLWASWQRWINPFIDAGREMNQPLRLLTGQHLYSDVYQLYGPWPPYLNAELYRWFGVSLTPLYFAGWVVSLLAVVLVYRLARRLLPPWPALLATALFQVSCVFTRSGAFLFLYSFAALYAMLCGLAGVWLTMRLVTPRSTAGARDRQAWSWEQVGAAVLAGLALSAKIEIGAAVFLTILGVLWLRGSKAWLGFAAIAAAVAGGLYAIAIHRAGFQAVILDSYLLLYNLPASLRYYNTLKSGTDHALRSLGTLLLGAGVYGLLLVAAVYWAGRAGGREQTSAARPRVLLPWVIIIAGLGAAGLLLHGHLRGPNRDLGLLTLLVVLALLARWWRHWRQGARAAQALSSDGWLLLILAAHAMFILLRVFLRVPAGGVNGSLLLATPIVLLVVVLCRLLPGLRLAPYRPEAVRASELAARRRLHGAASLLLALLAAAWTGREAVRWRHDPVAVVRTARGTFRTAPELAAAFVPALNFIDQHTRPNEPILAVPEGSTLNFFSGRPNPSRYEIWTPGFVEGAGEAREMARVSQARPRYIFLFNRPTREFGAPVFGRDYDRAFWGWVQAHYRPVRVFGPGNWPALPVIGDRRPFIICYERRP